MEVPNPTLHTPFLSPVDFAIQRTSKHVAIIMDGNRRWARQRGLPTIVGHRRGLNRLLDLVGVLRSSDIDVLTLFGFASTNWLRDSAEVAYLMQLAEEALCRFTPLCLRERVRVEVVGRKDRLPEKLVAGIERVQHLTRDGDRHLRIAVDYSAREAIVAAARQVDATCDVEEFSQTLATVDHVDLLIRTGKEQRLSDFLLWECAFAELYFPDLYWPDFDADALTSALEWYQQRNRRFGA